MINTVNLEQEAARPCGIPSSGGMGGTLVALCAIVGVTLLIHWKTVIGSCEFTNYDSVTEYYAMAQYCQGKQFSDSMWTPETGLGWPVNLSGYWPIFSPVALTTRFLPLNVKWLCNFLCWFYSALAGVVMFFCARRFKMSEAGALTASLVYLLANWTIYHRFHVLLIGGFWLIPALLMLQPRMEPGGILPIAILVALVVLGVSPTIVLVSLAFCTAFLIVRFWNTRALIPAFARWVVALVCGVAIAGAQIVPCYLLARASERSQDFPLALSIWPLLRAIGGLFMAHFSLTPGVDLDDQVYVGAATIVLAALAISGFRKSREVKFFLLCMVMAFLLALGTSTPFWWLALRIPAVRVLGDPSRWLLVFVFCAAMTAGYGVDRLRRENAPTGLLRRTALIGFVLYSIVWIGSLTLYAGVAVGDATIRAYGDRHIAAIVGKPPHFHSRSFYERKLDGLIRTVRGSIAPWNPHFWAPWCAMAILFMAGRGASAGKSTRRLYAWAACGAAGLELLAVNVPFCDQEVSVPNPPSTCQAAALLPKDEGEYRIYTFHSVASHLELLQELGPMTAEERSRASTQFFNEVVYPQTNLHRGISQFGNPLPLIPRRETIPLGMLGWTRVFKGYNLTGYIWDPFLSPEAKAAKFLEHAKLLRVFNIRFVISTVPLASPSVKLVHQHDLIVSDRIDPVTIYLYEVLDCLPRAFAVHEVRTVSDDQEAAAVLLAPEFDPRGTVLVSESVSPETVQPLSLEGVSVEIVEYKPRYVRINVRSDGAGYLVLSDAWSSEWSATVDGKESKIYQANLACRAVRIGAGEHVVEFKHHARMLRYGLIVSAAGVVALCICGLGGLLRLRKASLRASERTMSKPQHDGHTERTH